MYKLKHFYKLMLGITLLILASCTKTFLDKKPSSNIVVPTRLDELRGLLDNETVVFQTPLIGTISADEYYLKKDDWLALYQDERNAYIWATDSNGDYAFDLLDWNIPFRQIFYANIVLEGVNKLALQTRQSEEAREVAGSAYFLRARALFNLAEHFSMPYDPATAESNPGIPIRLSADVNTFSARGTVAGTYRQVIDDMLRAGNSFSDTEVGSNKIRPNKLTVYGYLARIYLSMREYEKAGIYADSALSIYSRLIDYNTIDPAHINPFPPLNEETLLQNTQISGSKLGVTVSGILNVDTLLYDLYEDHDLRKRIWFKETASRISIRNSYSGLITFFSGLTTAELLLIRAESRARSGQLASAIKDLNVLLINRYEKCCFEPVSVGSKEAVLENVLEERRKELCFRGLRWSDIRRLNLEKRHIVQRRVLGSDTITLMPNDKRYALPIPRIEIDLGGLTQNSR